MIEAKLCEVPKMTNDLYAVAVEGSCGSGPYWFGNGPLYHTEEAALTFAKSIPNKTKVFRLSDSAPAPRPRAQGVNAMTSQMLERAKKLLEETNFPNCIACRGYMGHRKDCEVFAWLTEVESASHAQAEAGECGAGKFCLDENGKGRPLPCPLPAKDARIKAMEQSLRDFIDGYESSQSWPTLAEVNAARAALRSEA